MTYFNLQNPFAEIDGVQYCYDCGHPLGMNWDSCDRCGCSEEGYAFHQAWLNEEIWSGRMGLAFTPVWFEERARQNACSACGKELGSDWLGCNTCANSPVGQETTRALLRKARAVAVPF